MKTMGVCAGVMICSVCAAHAEESAFINAGEQPPAIASESTVTGLPKVPKTGGRIPTVPKNGIKVPTVPDTGKIPSVPKPPAPPPPTLPLPPPPPVPAIEPEPVVALPPAALPDWPSSTNFVSQVNAHLTWNLSQGGGVVVAVLDTGINSSHSAFSGRLLTGYNGLTNAIGGTEDDDGHGTHVAGIVGAAYDGKGMVGIAPRASILPVKVGNAQGIPYTAVNRGMEYTLGKAHILNMSFGGGSLGQAEIAQMQRSVTSGQLLVAAAGNDRSPEDPALNPIWPARYAKEAWANSQIIAVGAVDRTNLIASFSNLAGDTKNWYVVAPGVNINSTAIGSGDPHERNSGTSMAAPVVSGLAANIWAYWPQLTAGQVADIIFKTCTDLGAPGVDEVYGRGLVNAQQAMAPVGMVQVPVAGAGTSFSTTQPLLGSKLVVSNAYAGALTQAGRSGAFSMVAVDEYQRDYLYDLGAVVVAADSMSLTQLFAGMDARQKYGEALLPGGATFAATYVDDFSQRDADRYQPTLTSFSYRQKYSDGKEFAWGSGNFAGNFFGLSDTPFNGLSFFGSETMANPFMGLARAKTFAGYALPLTTDPQGWKLRYGYMSASTLESAAPQGYLSRSDHSGIGIMEFSHKAETQQLAFSAGYLREDQGFLGGKGTAALAFNQNVDSFHTGVSLAQKIAPDTWIAGTFNLGLTPEQDNIGSIVSAVGKTTSYSWSLGLVADNSFQKGDRLGVSISQPLKVISGNMTLLAAVDVDADGLVWFEPRKLALKPQHTELDFEMNYTINMGSHGLLTGALLHRNNPGHNAAANDLTMLGLRYSWHW